jgi:hypothetical protein
MGMSNASIEKEARHKAGFFFLEHRTHIEVGKPSDSRVCQQTLDGAEASVSAATPPGGLLLSGK